MILVVVNLIVIECLVFFLMVIGAFVLSHLGLSLVSRIDALLSPESREPFANPRLGGTKRQAISTKR